MTNAKNLYAELSSLRRHLEKVCFASGSLTFIVLLTIQSMVIVHQYVFAKYYLLYATLCADA